MTNKKCEHGIRKSRCRPCGGGEICEHDKRRSRCVECKGGEICEHGRMRCNCKTCKGSQICNHERLKSLCIECKGSGICEHARIRSQCKECHGSKICSHGQLKPMCIICTPNTKAYCASCRLFRVFKKTNYLCSYCNPDKKRSQKTKEIRVKELLESSNISFVHDKTVSNECCLKYRPDFVIDCVTYYIVLECDEDAHVQYDKECEIIRMNNISHSLGLPTKFIRYNPDKKGLKAEQKEDKLIKELKRLMKNFDNIEPLYLFY